MHISETRIMRIQRLVMQEFGPEEAVAVHGALSLMEPWKIEESHGMFGGNALHELQQEYRKTLGDKSDKVESA